MTKNKRPSTEYLLLWNFVREAHSTYFNFGFGAKKLFKKFKKYFTTDYHYRPSLQKEFIHACNSAFKATMGDHPEYKKKKLDSYFCLYYSKRFLGQWIAEIDNKK